MIVSPSLHSQRGMTLVIVLIFLMLLTMLGIAAMSTTTLQEKMAGNLKDQTIAFQSAESAARFAEAQLRSKFEFPDLATGSSNAAVDVWPYSTTTDYGTVATSWWSSNAEEYGAIGTDDIRQAATDPRYIIQYRAPVQEDLSGESMGIVYIPHAFNIYAHGTGQTLNARSVVQTTYIRRF